MSYKIGYARVSTQDQNLDLQIDALQKAGCQKIVTEKASGAKVAGAKKKNAKGVETDKIERPELHKLLTDILRPGDVFVVYKLDRLARSLKQLIEIVENLNNRGIGFQSLNESIDTTVPHGRLFFHIFGAISEFERDLIRERTMAGLQSARARGRKGGRPSAVDDIKLKMIRTLYADKNNSIGSICKTLGISKTTLYKYIQVKDNGQ